MKKSILSIGKALNRLEQKEINGGYGSGGGGCLSLNAVCLTRGVTNDKNKCCSGTTCKTVSSSNLWGNCK